MTMNVIIWLSILLAEEKYHLIVKSMIQCGLKFQLELILNAEFISLVLTDKHKSNVSTICQHDN